MCNVGVRARAVPPHFCTPLPACRCISSTLLRSLFSPFPPHFGGSPGGQTQLSTRFEVPARPPRAGGSTHAPQAAPLYFGGGLPRTPPPRLQSLRCFYTPHPPVCPSPRPVLFLPFIAPSNFVCCKKQKLQKSVRDRSRVGLNEWF